MSVVPLGGLLGVGSLAALVNGAEGSAGAGGSRATGRSSVALAPVHRMAGVASDAEARGLLPVFVQPLRPADRGKLALVIEEAVEVSLERRGACPPGVSAGTDLESSVADQLYRARLIEARGLCLFLGSLEGVTTLAGALDAEDSAVLRWWLDAPGTLPVRVVLDETNANVLVYGAPLPLSRWLEPPGASAGASQAAPLEVEASPAVAPEIAASAEAMELSEPPPQVELRTATEAAEPAETPTSPAAAERSEEDATSHVAAAAEAAPSDEPTVAPVLHGPLHPAASTEWQRWVRELETARGPKPLATVERMFVMSYVPLRDAYLRGIAPSEVLSVLETWATSFASSYREAFEAMRVRGKRPTMVLDVPDAAMRIGRLHGARSVQLLLVDGLRFDLGLRVELGLRARLGREVALTERLLLWSALPSTSETQLELIGRGPDGLKELTAAPDSEIPVARGRMAKTPRRIKAGHRELLKLDLVEARLSEPGSAEVERLDVLGAEVTDAVAELCEKLPPRTLLFVFGDHGFCLDAQGDGTSARRQGGARPEEVLVPAFAWLVGGVQ